MLRRLFSRLRRRGRNEDEAPELDRLLAQAAEAKTFADRVEWLRGAIRWIEKDLEEPDDTAGISRAHARVRFLHALAPVSDTLREQQESQVGALPHRVQQFDQPLDRRLVVEPVAGGVHEHGAVAALHCTELRGVALP